MSACANERVNGGDVRRSKRVKEKRNTLTKSIIDPVLDGRDIPRGNRIAPFGVAYGSGPDSTLTKTLH